MVNINENDNIFDKRRFEEFCRLNKFEFSEVIND